jgi:hypothetical protein
MQGPARASSPAPSGRSALPVTSNPPGRRASCRRLPQAARRGQLEVDREVAAQDQVDPRALERDVEGVADLEVAGRGELLAHPRFPRVEVEPAGAQRRGHGRHRLQRVDAGEGRAHRGGAAVDAREAAAGQRSGRSQEDADAEQLAAVGAPHAQHAQGPPVAPQSGEQRLDGPEHARVPEERRHADQQGADRAVHVLGPALDRLARLRERPRPHGPQARGLPAAEDAVAVGVGVEAALRAQPPEEPARLHSRREDRRPLALRTRREPGARECRPVAREDQVVERGLGQELDGCGQAVVLRGEHPVGEEVTRPAGAGGRPRGPRKIIPGCPAWTLFRCLVAVSSRRRAIFMGVHPIATPALPIGISLGA